MVTTTPGTTAPASRARHLVASAVVVDPHPADRVPRVLLVWSARYRAWIFPTAHMRRGESLAETALRAATTAGVIDARLAHPTPLQRVPGLCVVDGPWRTYTIPAPAHRNTDPGSGLPWHDHIDHLFIAVADSTPHHAPPPRGTHWWPVNDPPAAARPDIPALAHAAAHQAAATVPPPYRQPGHQHCPQDHQGRSHR